MSDAIAGQQPLRLDWMTTASIAVATLTLGSLLAVLPLGLVGFGSLAVVSLILSVERPVVALGILVATVPLQRAGAFTLGPLELTATKVVVASVMVGFCWRWAVGRHQVRIDVTTLAFSALLIALMASIAHTDLLGAWAGEMYRWFVALVVYVIARNCFDADDWIAPVIGGLMLGIWYASIQSILQAATGAGPASYQVGGLTRVYGGFGAPNPLAFYLVAAMLPLVAVLIGSARLVMLPGVRTRWFDLLLLGTITAGTGVLLLTRSRGGLLGFGVGLTVVALLSGGRWALLLGVFGAVGLMLLYGVASSNPAFSRFTDSLVPGTRVLVTPVSWATQERFAHWRAAIAIWREHPILGGGAGGFDAAYRTHTQDWRFRIPRGHAHNTLLQLASEAGVVAVLAYLATVGSVIATCSRRVQMAVTPSLRALPIGALGVSTAVLAQGLFDYVHVLSIPIVIAVIWAMGTTQTGGNHA